MNNYVNNMRNVSQLYFFFLFLKRKYFHYIFLKIFCIIKNKCSIFHSFLTQQLYFYTHYIYKQLVQNEPVGIISF